MVVFFLGQLMHITYFATPLELRGENVSKINKNFDFHCKFVLLYKYTFDIALSYDAKQSVTVHCLPAYCIDFISMHISLLRYFTILFNIVQPT